MKQKKFQNSQNSRNIQIHNKQLLHHWATATEIPIPQLAIDNELQSANKALLVKIAKELLIYKPPVSRNQSS
jgi:hypothetical protein